MTEPWHTGHTPEEQALRKEAYQRLVNAAMRVGVSLEQLARLLRRVAQNEVETRRFLAEEVYGAPDDMLDDLIRVRMGDLHEENEGGAEPRR
jgi:hypothetical protein